MKSKSSIENIFLKTSRYLWLLFFDTIFPRGKLTKRIESMSAHTFYIESDKSIDEYNWIHSLFSYKDPMVKQAVAELKYYKNNKIIQILSDLLYTEILHEIEDRLVFGQKEKQEVILLPVPLTPRRRRSRGFNQSQILVQHLVKLDTTNILTDGSKYLYKIRDTQNQSSTKNRTERERNIRNCFLIKDVEKIKDAEIIIIDDVYTTGATLCEIKKILRPHTSKITAYTIAH